MTMTQEERNALREAASKATQGGWKTNAVAEDIVVSGHVMIADCNGYPRSNNELANARYIALAHPAAVLSLLDENARLREALAAIARRTVREPTDGGYRIAEAPEAAIARVALEPRA
jgi:hypothetical protein